jgi:hypothetical protein
VAGKNPDSSTEQEEKPDLGRDEVTGEPSESSRTAAPRKSAGASRWRQIEVMRERAELRKMLDDLDMDFDEFEMEVFGSDTEHNLMYRPEQQSEEEDIEADIDMEGEGDGFDESEFDEMEDDPD